MNSVYKIITICGSMRYYAEMLRLAAELTRRGNIVLMPFAIKDHVQESDVALDLLHEAKIDMSDEVIVMIDQNRYFGESTMHEVEYSAVNRKTIDYVYAEDYRG